MKVLIIGGSGLVGGNCFRHFKKQGAQVVATHLAFSTDETVYYNSCDLDDPENYDVKAFGPDIVVHCGALTNVDYCEKNEKESYQKTVQSAINVVSVCRELNAKLVYTSTDYVFDGRDGPYTEEAKINPLSIYARHKVAAEKEIKENLKDALILRITNVYGDEIRGKNFIARIINDIARDREWNMRLPYDQYATPINAFDIARVAWILIRDGKSGIYNVASTDFMNRCQLAAKVISYFPYAKASITPVSTKELNQAADRPLTGGLLSTKFLSEYPDFKFHNVDDYLKMVFDRTANK